MRSVLCFSVLIPQFCAISGLSFTVVCCNVRCGSVVLCYVLICIMLWDDDFVIRYDLVCTIFCDLLHWEMLSAVIYYFMELRAAD